MQRHPTPARKAGMYVWNLLYYQLPDNHSIMRMIVPRVVPRPALSYSKGQLKINHSSRPSALYIVQQYSVISYD
jgi:hypothetical protein